MATDLLILRDRIDDIDKQIVGLYEKRMEVCKEVAEFKIETGKKVFDKVREAEKIEKVKSMAISMLYRSFLSRLCLSAAKCSISFWQSMVVLVICRLLPRMI